RVNTIIPGPIEGTEGMERLAPTDAAKRAAAEMTPMKRFGRKSEVGDAALFLASPMAAYITGGNIPVDGGTVLTGSSSMSRGMEMAFEGAAQAARSRA
ncbi:MAG: SDR family oxidoreductase, partial [Rhodospirillaceae bacterium]|nr:SDR family oxidoreductase [Rhodospirillaceae bacterium]